MERTEDDFRGAFRGEMAALRAQLHNDSCERDTRRHVARKRRDERYIENQTDFRCRESEQGSCGELKCNDKPMD